MPAGLVEERTLQNVDLSTVEKLATRAAKQTLFFRMFPAYLLTWGFRFKGNSMRVFITIPPTHATSGQVKLIPVDGGCRVVLEWGRDNYVSRWVAKSFWDNLEREASVSKQHVSSIRPVIAMILLSVVALISLYGIAIDYAYLQEPANYLEKGLGVWGMIMHGVTLAGALLAGILTLMRNWWSRAAGHMLFALFCFRLLQIIFYYTHSFDPLPQFEPIGVQFTVFALVFASWICVGNEA